MFDPFKKPAKAYRTVGEAFKDADYACALHKVYKDPTSWSGFLPYLLVFVLSLLSYTLVVFS